MSVDKFGHFSINNTKVLKRDAPKVFGFFIDENRDLNIQNKKIKNLGSPAEQTDAVNKVYVQSQVNHSEEVLKKIFNKQIVYIRQEIINLRNDIKDIFGVLASLSRNHGEKSNR